MRFTIKQKRWLAGGSIGVAMLLWGVVISKQLASSPVQQLVEQGQAFALRGEAGHAEQAWLRASQLDPKSTILWQLLGDLYLNTSQWDKAKKAFQKLVEIAPETPHAYTGLAVATLRLGDEVDAYKWAKEAVKRNPKDASSLQIVAFASGYMGRTEEQLATLRQLLSLQPRDTEVLEMCIEAFSGQKKFDELRKVADTLIEVQPTNTMAYGVRALVLLESDGSPEALTAAEKDLVHALQIAPLYGYARFQLGRLYLRQSRWNDAILQLEQAQKLSPRQMDVPFELATAYTRAGKLDKAAIARARFQVLRDETNRLNVVTKKSSLEPDNFEANLEVGEITLKNGDLRKAGYFLMAAVKLKPSDPRAKKAYAELVTKIKARTQASQSQ
ncbi:tetratricopeptide repeat protein [Armatimonas sp.]|uniref:tetratricopeptide repeat protein n=1 Tax=Armatimonas sp. TaxID=1872638 RepID=UPI00286AF97E|nr:tetratricopeptide repeat protein [Armatimonas sp.]